MERLLLILTFILTFFVLEGCEHNNRVGMLKYKKSVLEDRKKKEQFFKFSANSPIAETERWKFTALNYFPVDESYKVTAIFTLADKLNELKMQTSTGQAREYIVVGTLSFSLKGQEFSLNSYMEKEWIATGQQKPLFVPFTDQTTGKSSYGAGRYLDFEISKEKQEVIIDFNMAYNPYCAYNPTYSCPVPPQENHLPVLIEAGEKNYKEI